MTHPTHARTGPVGSGDSGFAPEATEEGPLGESVRDPQGRHADESAAPAAHGGAARPDLGATRHKAAAEPARKTTPVMPHPASPVVSQEARRRAARTLPEEARIPPAAVVLALKWAGVTLLVVAGLMALYLGAGLLGELAVRAAYP